MDALKNFTTVLAADAAPVEVWQRATGSKNRSCLSRKVQYNIVRKYIHKGNSVADGRGGRLKATGSKNRFC